MLESLVFGIAHLIVRLLELSTNRIHDRVKIGTHMLTRVDWPSFMKILRTADSHTVHVGAEKGVLLKNLPEFVNPSRDLLEEVLVKLIRPVREGIDHDTLRSTVDSRMNTN
jgi:hypothetical protein